MNNETKKLLAIFSAALALFVIVLLLLLGFDVDLGGIEIHRGIKLN